MGQRGMNRRDGALPFRGPRATALLVMEEERGGLQYYCDILEVFGYRLEVCRSYQEGVLRLGRDVFDFVLVSQGTPRFEGSCVLKRALELNRSLPVLVVARCLDMSCYLEAMQLGAVDYLVEPLTVLEIGRVLENHPPLQNTTASRNKGRKKENEEITAEAS